MTSPEDDNILWGARITSAKLMGVDLLLGNTSVFSYELMPTMNVIYARSMASFNETCKRVKQALAQISDTVTETTQGFDVKRYYFKNTHCADIDLKG